MASDRGPGWVRRVGPWVGIGTSPAALMTGGGMASRLQGPGLVASVGIGVGVLCTLAAAQGIAGQRRGRPLVGLLEPALGRAGARHVAGAVMALMMLGWFGVNVDAAGTAAARLVGLPTWAGITAFALLALAVTVRGIGRLSDAALVAGLATTALVVWALAVRHTPDGAAAGADGTLGILAGAALVVGYGAAFALRTPDFTADLRHPREVVWCAALGLGLPLAAFAGVGVLLFRDTGVWVVADVWRALGASRLGYAIIAVGFFGSVMTNLFSGALAGASAGRIPHRVAMSVFLAAGLALALAGLADSMLDYLLLMTITAPGLVVLCVARWADGDPARAFNPRGLAAWGVSVLAGLACARWAPGLVLPVTIVSCALVAGCPMPRKLVG